MKRYRRLLFLFASALNVVALCGRAADSWRLHEVALTPASAETTTLRPGILRATVSRNSDQPVVVSAPVTLTKVKESFVWQDRLAVLGEAGRAAAVVIVDLSTQRLLDWFYCYEPRRLSDTLIASVEFYFAHGTGEPTDVVLLYDLARNPRENRVGQAADVRPPPSISENPEEVGIPVFPQSNFREHSYANWVPKLELARHLLSSPMILLASKKLVFPVADREANDPNRRNYLMVIDLSKGVNGAVHSEVAIPRDQFTKMPDNRLFVDITGMEAAGADAVKLHVSKEKYGVSSITVDLSGSVGGSGAVPPG